MIEDADILKKVSKGDRSAFDSLFRKYHRYLVSIAFGYTKDLELSRDLSQEVFLYLWKRREKIDINISFKAFIRRAVINQSLSKLRVKQKFDQVGEEGLRIASTYDSFEDLNYKELARAIKRSVSNLPGRCREIFELSRYQGKSHKEIASQLDISTKTIENQMTKALKKIRLDLKDGGLLVTVLILLRGCEPFFILLINHIDI